MKETYSPPSREDELRSVVVVCCGLVLVTGRKVTLKMNMYNFTKFVSEKAK